MKRRIIEIDKEKCNGCMKKTLYDADCMIKLRWYEDNDDRVSNMEPKDRDRFDCGVKCSEYLHNGIPVFYPDGWS